MHLYIHIPYCISKCDYCDFFSIPLLKKNLDNVPEEINVPDEYIVSLLNEIKYRLNTTQTTSLSTVYIGGGTPSLLKPEQIRLLMNLIKKECTLEPDAEVTIEMNPETVSVSKLEACEENGINRLSLGIQSLADSSLECVHRHCSSQKAFAALDLIKKNWKGRFSVDVITGLPETTDEQFESTVKKLIEYNPDHFSMYSLCIEEETPLGKKVIADEGYYAEALAEKSDRQWITGRNILKENGYFQYEVSNFAKKGFEAVHNSAYWKQEDYIGCGAGACGTIYSFGEVYEKEQFRGDRPLESVFTEGIRTTNTTDLEKYIEYWKNIPSKLNEKKDCIWEENIPHEKEFLDIDTEEYEYFMMGLRMLEGIEEEKYSSRFRSIPETKGVIEKHLLKKGSLWKEFEKKNYVKVYKNIHGKKIYSMTEEGILFLNPLLESLL